MKKYTELKDKFDWNPVKLMNVFASRRTKLHHHQSVSRNEWRHCCVMIYIRVLWLCKREKLINQRKQTQNHMEEDSIWFTEKWSSSGFELRFNPVRWRWPQHKTMNAHYCPAVAQGHISMWFSVPVYQGILLVHLKTGVLSTPVCGCDAVWGDTGRLWKSVQCLPGRQFVPQEEPERSSLPGINEEEKWVSERL